DSTLVGECLWRAVSFRLHRPADDFLVSLEPETNDASLAAFVARYDRTLARALSPGVDKTVVPNQDRLDSRFVPLVMIDADEAMEKLRVAATSHDADATRCFQAAFYLTRLLPVDASHRWDRLASQHSLWIPDNQYADDP
ncbi:MAG: hypothetical protein ABSG53_16925, partial [Thermoguttaceae bacterium]